MLVYFNRSFNLIQLYGEQISWIQSYRFDKFSFKFIQIKKQNDKNWRIFTALMPKTYPLGKIFVVVGLSGHQYRLHLD